MLSVSGGIFHSLCDSDHNSEVFSGGSYCGLELFSATYMRGRLWKLLHRSPGCSGVHSLLRAVLSKLQQLSCPEFEIFVCCFLDGKVNLFPMISSSPGAEVYQCFILKKKKKKKISKGCSESNFRVCQ